MEESDSTVLCIDYALNGIGSNSCGPEVLAAYRFDEKEFQFGFTLVPYVKDDMRRKAMEEKKYLKWYNKVGYGSGDVAGNVVYAFLSSFVMIYLTDTVGLNPASSAR